MPSIRKTVNQLIFFFVAFGWFKNFRSYGEDFRIGFGD